MGIKSKGRGTAAAIGLLLLFAGIAGSLVLYAVSVQRPGRTIDGFARAPVGCTTTMEFADTGTFYVFQEVGGAATLPDGECVPVPDTFASFDVVITGPAFELTADESLGYDEGGRTARSLYRLDISEPGQYRVRVAGDDPAELAAVGRDPDDGVSDLRRQAVIVAVVGGVLGLALLLLSGWRSKRAATYATPEGPGWGPSRRPLDSSWVPEGPRLGQRPVNPQQPDEPAEVAPEPPPLPAREPASRLESPWGAPSADDVVDEAPPEPAEEPPPVPEPTPLLPRSPGRPSGVSPDLVPPPVPSAASDDAAPKRRKRRLRGGA